MLISTTLPVPVLEARGAIFHASRIVRKVRNAFSGVEMVRTIAKLFSYSSLAGMSHLSL
jgi:hypothetical protein